MYPLEYTNGSEPVCLRITVLKNPGKIVKVLNRKYQLSFAFKITELNCILQEIFV